jgi:hypothetical protein
MDKRMLLITFVLMFQFAFGTLERMTYEYNGVVYDKITRKLIRDNLEISLYQEPYDCAGYAIGDTAFSFYTDAMWHRIIYARAVEPDSEIKYAKAYGAWGNGIKQFRAPHGIAIDGAQATYIADTDNGRVVKLKLQADTLAWIGVIGAGILEKPWDVEIEGDKLYVIDAGLHKVFRFSLSGAYQLSYGGYGFTEGKFNKPKGIAVFGNLIS